MPLASNPAHLGKNAFSSLQTNSLFLSICSACQDVACCVRLSERLVLDDTQAYKKQPLNGMLETTVPMVSLHLNLGCVLYKRQNSKLLVKIQKQFNEGRMVFQQEVQGQLGIHRQKKMNLTKLTSYKQEFKWNIDLNVKCETIKFLEGKSRTLS